MMRIPSAAAVLAVIAAGLLRAQEPSELSLTHFAGENEVATSRLLVSRFEVRAKGQSKAAGSQGALDLLAILQLSENGGLKRYDRELKAAKDGLLVSGISVVSEDDVLRFRETGPMGVRTKTLSGPSVDLVMDGSCPEMIIPFMLDGARKSVRVLLLPDLEIKTVVLEDRGDLGRYAAIPGGGVTLFVDAAGAFQKLALPGPVPRTIVRAGTESRPAPPRGRETPIVLTLDGDVRLGLNLTLPAGGQPPYPGVLLLGDSGPRDRTGAGGGSLVPVLSRLSDELASQGIASVRADKRGVGQSAGPEAGLQGLVDDARSLVEVLLMHPAIDRDRVFVAGHGEGAIVAVELAKAGRDRIAGVIALASPARPLAEALEARLRVRLLAEGQSKESIEGAAASLRAEIESLRELPESAPVGPGQALLRDLAKIDPAIQFAAVKVPMLVIHAGDDREVPASQVALMRASLAFSGFDRLRFELVEGADHDLLVTATSALLGSAAPQSADLAREVHPRIPALIREFTARAAASRPSSR